MTDARVAHVFIGCSRVDIYAHSAARVHARRPPHRGGWFNKCQALSYAVLAYGPMSDEAVNLALEHYSGPEALAI